MPFDSVLEVLSEINQRLGSVEELSKATHAQAVKTNGRVGAQEARWIAYDAATAERERLGVLAAAERSEDRQERADDIARRSFRERWLDRILTIALTLLVAGASYLLGTG